MVHYYIKHLTHSYLHYVDYLLVYQKKQVVVRFFLSSRRRHTSWPRDWSSDVCSSDLDFQAHRRVHFVTPGGPRDGQITIPCAVERHRPHLARRRDDRHIARRSTAANVDSAPHAARRCSQRVQDGAHTALREYRTTCRQSAGHRRHRDDRDDICSLGGDPQHVPARKRRPPEHHPAGVNAGQPLGRLDCGTEISQLPVDGNTLPRLPFRVSKPPVVESQHLQSRGTEFLGERSEARVHRAAEAVRHDDDRTPRMRSEAPALTCERSEEHTSELQS